MTCGSKQTKYIKLAKRNYAIGNFNFNLKNISDDNYFNSQLKNISEELNNKKDDILNTSSEVAMENIIKSLKMVEDRVRKEKLNDIEVSVSIALGPINIGLSKVVSVENDIILQNNSE